MFVCLSANCRTLSYSAFCGSLITRSGQASVSSAVVTYHGLMVSILLMKNRLKIEVGAINFAIQFVFFNVAACFLDKPALLVKMVR